MIKHKPLTQWRDQVAVAEPEVYLELAVALEIDGGGACRKLAGSLRRKHARWEAEQQRLSRGYLWERTFWNRGRLVAGVDEVGRGPLAGPVVAAAVVLPEEFFLPGLRDSKEVPPDKRLCLSLQIRAVALAIGVGQASTAVIEREGIVAATRKAMAMALRRMGPFDGVVLVDALELPGLPWEITPIIHGDRLSNSIAAASIIAKVTRDAYMDRVDRLYPGYGFARHKGYGTKEHRGAILDLGASPVHRAAFVRTFLAEK